MSRERATLAAVNNALSFDASSANSALIFVVGGSVAAVGANIIFEGSPDSTDGTNGAWFPVPAIRSNANTQETSTGALSLGVGVANGYYHRVNMLGFQFFRARLTAITSGNVAVSIGGSGGTTETAPFLATHAVTLTSTTANPPTGTAYSLVTAATTNGALILAGTVGLTELSVSNPTATPAFVKLYNKATAPTVGTDVPVATIPIAANAYLSMEFGVAGKRFPLGLGIAVTGAIAATDTTATVAGIQISGTRI